MQFHYIRALNVPLAINGYMHFLRLVLSHLISFEETMNVIYS